MKHVAALLMVLALPLAAQEQKKEPGRPSGGPMTQKIFILKYADPNAVRTLLSVFTGGIVPDREMHALSVQAPREVMPAIEEAIQRLDVPSAAPKNIELTVWLIMAGDSEAGGPSVPKELDSVVTQLKSSFPFKDYRLLDALNLRTRTGKPVETNSAGGTGQADKPTTVMTVFRFNSASVAPDGTIRIDGLRSGTRFTAPGEAKGSTFSTDLGINTDVDLKEGQKVVVGRVGASSGQALFLVLTARVVQ